MKVLRFAGQPKITSIIEDTKIGVGVFMIDVTQEAIR